MVQRRTDLALEARELRQGEAHALDGAALH